MSNLDQMLREKNPVKFTNELVDFIVDPDLGGLSPRDLTRAPSLVKGFIFIRAFDGTIADSGIYKWLIELYDDYPKLDELFDLIYASEAAAYVRAAIRLFPKEIVTKDIDERLDFCDEHENELNELDRKFQGASEDAILKFREYIVAHRTEFESQVQIFWKLRKK